MKRFLFIFLFFPLYAQARVAILISIDGFAANYFPDSHLKTFSKLKEEKVFGRLRPPFPSITFPSHTTMITGCSPGKHGIVGNRFVDKSKGSFEYEEDPSWVECEPLWAAAERQKIKTVIIHWPLSYGKWNGIEATFHEPKFDKDRTDKDSVAELLDKLRQSSKDHTQLFIMYLHGPDPLGHKFGPQSSERKDSLEKTDSLIGKFLKQVEEIKDLGEHAVFIVSDHGMTNVSEVIQINKILKEKKVPGVVTAESPLFYLYLWHPLDRDRVLSLFSGLNFQVYSSLHTPKEWGRVHPRMGDLIGYAEPPKMFSFLSDKKDAPKGTHGYDPKLSDMAGIFFALGDGVETKKEVAEFDNIRIAATVSNYLEIKSPKDSVNKPLVEIFSKKKNSPLTQTHSLNSN